MDTGVWWKFCITAKDFLFCVPIEQPKFLWEWLLYEKIYPKYKCKT